MSKLHELIQKVMTVRVESAIRCSPNLGSFELSGDGFNGLGFLDTSAAINFPLLLLECIGEKRRLGLLKIIQVAVINASADECRELEPRTKQRLDPDAPDNALQHEFEHGIAARPFKRIGATASLVFLHDREGRVVINGTCQYGLAKFNAAEVALIFSNPASLGANDVSEARKFARLASASEVIETTEQRIARRKQHRLY